MIGYYRVEAELDNGNVIKLAEKGVYEAALAYVEGMKKAIYDEDIIEAYVFIEDVLGNKRESLWINTKHVAALRIVKI